MKLNKTQLRIGARVEKEEHRNVLPYIVKYKKKYGRYPKAGLVAKVIAASHLRETPQYYKRLRKAKL